MNRRSVFIAISLALTVVTGLVYWHVRNFEFVLYDDPDYVTSNFHVLDGLTWHGFLWAFTAGHADNWHPITWLSHMLDAQLFGSGSYWPHMVNLLLHCVNTLVFFHVLQKMTGAIWRSAFVATLFALHPLHVESVAWISERKDVLSAFFFVLTISAYVRFVEELKARGGKQKRFYWLALSLFCLGLMSKPMLVTLPFVLLLLDFWPLQRCDVTQLFSFDPAGRRLVIEKIPFFILSVAASIITFLVQKNSRDVLARLTVDTRLENALVSYARYLAKAIFPRNLSVLYPYPDHWPLLAIAGAGGLLAVLTIAAIWTRRSRPYFATGWFWFLGMLVPVIGLVQVGEQSMADRYFYLPSIGIFIVAAWGGTDLMNRAHFPKFAIGTTGVTILILGALRTSNQLQNWRDSETLFRHAIAVTTNNYSAYIDLGSALSARGFDDKASECFNKAIDINPNSFDAYRSSRHCVCETGQDK